MNNHKTKLLSITNEKRFYILILVCLVLATIWIGIVDLGPFAVEASIARFFITFFCISTIDYLIRKKRQILLKSVRIAGIILVIGILGIITTLLLIKIGIISVFSKRMVIVVFSALLTILLLFLFINDIIPEEAYLAFLVFVVGSMFAVSFPAGTGVSWDDQIHYESILQISHANDGKYSTADDLLINSAYPTDPDYIMEHSINGTVGEFEKKVNTEYNKGKKSPHMTFDLRAGVLISYLPEAIALFLARGLSIPYTYVFFIGRWIGVFFFSICLYITLSRLKSGKVTAFIISMLPTVLFLMGNYSYDTWCICISMLAFAYYIGIMQREERKMQKKDIIIICILFALSYAAKPNYFCMILALCFISKAKLDKSLSPRIYHTTIIVTSMLLAASFVIPYLVSGAGGNDTRAFGDAVNSAEQVRFILDHPFKYTVILLRFLKSYLSITNLGHAAGYFAYYGIAKFSVIYFIIAIVFILLDKQSEDNNVTSAKARIWTLLLVFVAVCIYSTILYVGFNPVANDTIRGVQGRYAIPLFFFIGYYISDYRLIKKIRIIITEKVLVVASSVIVTVYAFYCLYSLVICYY